MNIHKKKDDAWKLVIRLPKEIKEEYTSLCKEEGSNPSIETRRMIIAWIKEKRK